MSIIWEEGLIQKPKINAFKIHRKTLRNFNGENAQHQFSISQREMKGKKQNFNTYILSTMVLLGQKL